MDQSLSNAGVEPMFTGEVGRKFYRNGAPRTFPGNTVICFVQPDSNVFQLAEWVQAQLANREWASKFVFLPPSSFHMTVMELLCDQVRTPEKWASQLSLDAPLQATDRYFIRTVKPIPPPRPIRMRFHGMGRHNAGIKLEPADSETKEALRGYREQIADNTGVRFPDHDRYRFHISLAYRLIELTDAEERDLNEVLDYVDQHLNAKFGLFEPDAPQLTFFDNMCHFATVDQRRFLRSRADTARSRKRTLP